MTNRIVTIVNLTPHNINLIKDNGEVEVFAASGKVARCEEETKHVINYNGISVFEKKFGNVSIENIDKTIEEMPLEYHGSNVIYIVSNLVMSALSSRSDLIAPNDIIRNDKGQIVGCKSFSM